MSMPLAEHDYIGLSELIPSMEGDSEKPSIFSEANERNKGLNFKATELRLGLPGSQSPERDFGHGALKGLVSGAKRGFSDTIRRGSGNWVLSAAGGSDPDSAKTESNAQPPPAMASAVGKEAAPLSPKPEPEKKPQISAPNGQGNAPAAKAQVVGWPPIRSFRKNSMASNNPKNVDHDADAQISSVGAQVVGWPPIRSFLKNSMASKNPKNVDHDADAKLGPGCLYVKVSMDGAPYLRKIDLKTYSSYAELSSALEKMFSCFTIGQCGSNGAPGRDGLGESRLIDHLHGSEYVLTFEDKDNDWMLVGDVPWEIFTDSCKRLRIMKRSDAIGLAPRAMEKCKSRN